MSIASMNISIANKLDHNSTVKYNTSQWAGNVILNDDFDNFTKLQEYLTNKYDNVYYIKINLAKGFNGQYVEPNKIYQEIKPLSIMVKDKDSLKLIVVKAKQAREFVAYATSGAKNTFVPLVIYKKDNNINILNIK